MAISERLHILTEPYAKIHRKLMAPPADWMPNLDADPEDELSKLPFYEDSMEGPAGTGKTYFEGSLVEDLHLKYQRLRTLVLRKTRSSMSESWMEIFENKVLGQNHPILRHKLQRRTRNKYVFPNGSEIVLGGMNNPEALFSTEYDLIIVVEAIEFTEDEYESLFRALRNQGVPWKAMILDTNPGAETHFLNRRPEIPGARMKRVLTRHKHNPAYWHPKFKRWTPMGAQYMENLRQMTGTRRKRLYEGEWCAAEGSIWENFDAAIHIVERGEITDKKPDGDKLPDFDYFIGGIDWGWNDCKVLQIWGVTHDRRAYRVYERYGTHITMDTFIGWLKEVKEEYGRRGLVRIVADHDPEKIILCNEMLGWRGRQSVGNMVQAARKGCKSVAAGNDLVRELWGDPENKVAPKAFLVKGALREADPELVERRLPICTEQEIPSYVFKPQKEGKETVEIPDPGCVDHGCHTTRYSLWEIWKSDFSKSKGRIFYGKGTYGDAMGHNEFLKNMSTKEYLKYIEKNDI